MGESNFKETKQPGGPEEGEGNREQRRQVKVTAARLKQGNGPTLSLAERVRRAKRGREPDADEECCGGESLDLVQKRQCQLLGLTFFTSAAWGLVPVQQMLQAGSSPHQQAAQQQQQPKQRAQQSAHLHQQQPEQGQPLPEGEQQQQPEQQQQQQQQPETPGGEDAPPAQAALEDSTPQQGQPGPPPCDTAGGQGGQDAGEGEEAAPAGPRPHLSRSELRRHLLRKVVAERHAATQQRQRDALGGRPPPITPRSSRGSRLVSLARRPGSGIKAPLLQQHAASPETGREVGPADAPWAAVGSQEQASGAELQELGNVLPAVALNQPLEVQPAGTPMPQRQQRLEPEEPADSPPPATPGAAQAGAAAAAAAESPVPAATAREDALQQIDALLIQLSSPQPPDAPALAEASPPPGASNQQLLESLLAAEVTGGQQEEGIGAEPPAARGPTSIRADGGTFPGFWAAPPAGEQQSRTQQGTDSRGDDCEGRATPTLFGLSQQQQQQAEGDEGMGCQRKRKVRFSVPEQPGGAAGRCAGLQRRPLRQATPIKQMHAYATTILSTQRTVRLCVAAPPLEAAEEQPAEQPLVIPRRVQHEHVLARRMLRPGEGLDVPTSPQAEQWMQDLREAFLNARLAEAAAAGHQWALLDIAGCHLDVANTPSSTEVSASVAREHSEGAAERLLQQLETEWQHLRMVRMRYQAQRAAGQGDGAQAVDGSCKEQAPLRGILKCAQPPASTPAGAPAMPADESAPACMEVDSAGQGGGVADEPASAEPGVARTGRASAQQQQEHAAQAPAELEQDSGPEPGGLGPPRQSPTACCEEPPGAGQQTPSVGPEEQGGPTCGGRRRSRGMKLLAAAVGSGSPAAHHLLLSAARPERAPLVVAPPVFPAKGPAKGKLSRGQQLVRMVQAAASKSAV